MQRLSSCQIKKEKQATRSDKVHCKLHAPNATSSSYFDLLEEKINDV